MNYLIDTNAWIGFFEGCEDFGEKAKSIMSESPGSCHISMAGIWEAAIKTGLGKLILPYRLDDELPRLIEQNGFQILPITWEDATSVQDLERHHNDPFDRLQVIQARRRGWQVISRDQIFDQYALTRIWA